ncbi:MAG: hypothetical protein MZV64_05100 [Ignavibacteriales bacterium]|nr:hypothetical protein [Ignavibacteriales bacterium]
MIGFDDGQRRHRPARRLDRRARRPDLQPAEGRAGRDRAAASSARSPEAPAATPASTGEYSLRMAVRRRGRGRHRSRAAPSACAGATAPAERGT